MSSFVWPSDDGWPYPDGEQELIDPDGGIDDDALVLRAARARVLDGLDPLERQVISDHYGLEGRPPRSMKQLHADLGLSRAELRGVMGSALVKLRARLGE